MGSAAQFVAQFFPIFLLGAVFGKLMEDSGSVSAIADFMTETGPRRAVLAVVLAGAFVTMAASACSSLFSCWRPWRTLVPGRGDSCG